MLNTEKYIHRNKKPYQQKNMGYCYASVASDEDAGRLIETGWRHVCKNPSSGRMLIKKPK